MYVCRIYNVCVLCSYILPAQCNNDAIEDCVYYKEQNLKKRDYVVSSQLL